MARLLLLAPAFSAVLAAALLAPTAASAQTRARLVTCGQQNCLKVSGTRSGADAPVRINGHSVAVTGRRSWRVTLPLATVRAWSPPFARTLSVETALGSDEADLPIGLLGHRADLAMLVVTAK